MTVHSDDRAEQPGTRPGPDPADCIFCSIASGAAGVPLLAQQEGVVAFRDIDPKAPTHVLVVPIAHHRDAAALATADPQLLANLVTLGQQVADAEVGGQFRLVFNTGVQAGQSVFHVHGHVLGGRSFSWPPG